MKNKHNKFTMDLKDKKLLALLVKNYRFPVSFLAKKTGLSKDAVNYRINRFRKEGVIVGTDVVFNPFLAGIELYFVLLRFHNLSPAKEREIEKYLKRNSQVQFIWKLRGNWDVQLCVGARNPVEFDNFMVAFRNKFSDVIDEFVYLVEAQEAKFRQTPEVIYEGGEFGELNYKRNDSSFERDFELGPPIEISLGEVQKISKDEIKLLQALAKDIGISLTDLSKELGVSKDKLKANIKSLIKRGFLQAFWPIVSSEALGFQEHLLFFRFRRLDKEDKFESFMKRSKLVSHCARLIGQWDTYAWIKVGSLNEFYAFVEEIRKNFSDRIASIDSMLVEDVIKWDTLCSSNLLNNTTKLALAQLR